MLFIIPVQILLSFLTPGGNRLRNQICEVLDIDLIRQQAEHSAVDIQGLANYVISTMGKLCAPVRDDDIRELKATNNIVEVLRLVLAACISWKYLWVHSEGKCGNWGAQSSNWSPKGTLHPREKTD